MPEFNPFTRKCVKKCKDEFTSQFEEKKCLGCDIIFKAKRGKKYCNRECYLKNNMLERVDLNCNFCGKDYKKPLGHET